jgi:hypothetical protein
MQGKRPQSWRDWYQFARDTLSYEAQEATAYANLRYAEDVNRRARTRGVLQPDGHVDPEPASRLT